MAGVAAAAMLVLWPRRTAEGREMVVYKTPDCRCCAAWAERMTASGFRVSTRVLTDLSGLKRQHRVPPATLSCHTAVVEGLVVEGHVPARDILDALGRPDRPHGLAVPGMPVGSPGMEGPNPAPYAVVAFSAAGEVRVIRRP